MIDIKLPDEKFNLRKVSDVELFNAVKTELVEVLRSLKGYEQITSNDVKLNDKYTSVRERLGKDGNLYPFIVLDIGAKAYFTYDNFSLFVDPFSISFAPYNREIKEYPELTKSFVNFMVRKFPESNYLAARKKYFRKAQIRKKVEDDLLFF